MKINRVIVSTNDNEEYYQFWPLIASRWRSWGVTPTLAVVSKEKLDIDENLGDVLYIDPVPGLATSHQAQIVRFFAAASYENEISIISDIDMLCLNKEYFLDSVEAYDDDKFVVYSSDAYLPGNPAYPAYPMCYMAAQGTRFKEIIHGDLSNFSEEVPKWLAQGHSWFTDEKVFYDKLKEWRKQEDDVVLLRRGFNNGNHPIFIRRIDRGTNCEVNQSLLKENFYIDFHMPRPYERYKDTIDNIYEESKRR